MDNFIICSKCNINKNNNAFIYNNVNIHQKSSVSTQLSSLEPTSSCTSDACFDCQ